MLLKLIFKLILCFVCISSWLPGKVTSAPVVYIHIEADVNLLRCAYNASVLLGVPIEVDSTIHGERIMDQFVWVESMERNDTTYIIITEDDMHRYNADRIDAVDIGDLVATVQFMFGGRN